MPSAKTGMESALLIGEMKTIIKILSLFFIATALLARIGPVPEAAAAWKMGQNHFAETSNYYLTPPMRKVVKNILYRRFYGSEEQLARAIYQWVVKNVEYGPGFGSSTASRTFQTRRGKCAGLSRLFISLARDVGINARYVLVDVDCYGDPVKHACVLAEIDGKEKLIDPAYRIFDAEHGSWRIVEGLGESHLLALNK